MEERFVYVIEKPGSDVDGDDTVIRAKSRVEADLLATRREEAWNCTLRFIGMRDGKKFIAFVPPDQLPEWMREFPDGIVPADMCSSHEGGR